MLKKTWIFILKTHSFLDQSKRLTEAMKSTFNDNDSLFKLYGKKADSLVSVLEQHPDNAEHIKK